MKILKKISLIFMLLAVSGFAFAKADMFYNLNSSSSSATDAGANTSASWGDQTAFNFMQYPVTKKQLLIGGGIAALLTAGIVTAIVIHNNKKDNNDQATPALTPVPTNNAHIISMVMTDKELPTKTSPDYRYESVITFTNVGSAAAYILWPIRASIEPAFGLNTHYKIKLKSSCLGMKFLLPQKSCDVYLSFDPSGSLLKKKMPAILNTNISAIVTMNYTGGPNAQDQVVNTQKTSVQPTSPIQLEYDSGVSDTLYTNAVYNQAKFVFKNETSDTVGNLSASITNLTSPMCKCGTSAIACSSSCTLQGGGEYTVSGTYQHNVNGEKNITIDFSGKNNRTGKPFTFNFKKNIFTVPHQTDAIAIRVIGNNPALPNMFVNAGCNGNSKLIQFVSDGVIPGTSAESFTGTCSATNMDFTQGVKVKSGDVLYYPRTINAGNRLYMSYAAFTTTTQPVETPPIQSFAYIEPNYYPFGSGEELFVDLSYVNMMGIGIRMNMIGSSNNVTAGVIADNTFGQIDPSLTTDEIFTQLATDFDNIGHGWEQSVRRDGANKIFAIASASVSQLLPQTYYNAYIKDLLVYLKTHTVRVSAAGVGGPAYQNCVFTSKVVNISGQDEIVFVPNSSCPQFSPGVNPNNPNVLNPGSAPPWGNRPKLVDKADASGTYLHFLPNYCDISQAAGSFLCHVQSKNDLPAVETPSNLPANTALFGNGIKGFFGPNGTYRAEIGKLLLSYMTAGFLPSAITNNTVLSKTNLRKYKQLYFTDQYTAVLQDKSLPPIFDVYSHFLTQFFDVYTTAYSDELGLDNSITFNNNNIPGNNFPYAQPMTLNLY